MTQDRTSEALAIFQAQFPGDQSREVTDAAFQECMVDMTRLRKLPEGVDWDKDPYKILATKMFGGDVEAVNLAQRRAAKLAFWTCVTTLQPDWAESRSDAIFKGENPFKVVSRIEAFKRFAVSFFHDPTYPLTSEQINQAGRALAKCDNGMENWVEGDLEDPLTGWHPCTVLAAEMFDLTIDKLNSPQIAYAKLIYFRFKADK